MGTMMQVPGVNDVCGVAVYKSYIHKSLRVNKSVFNQSKPVAYVCF